MVIVDIEPVMEVNVSVNMARITIFPKSLKKEDFYMNCEHIDTCPVINYMSKSVPFTVNMMKVKYCEFNKYRCVRYKLLNISEMDDIPNDLWPGDEFRGLEILEMKLNESRQKLYGDTVK